MTIPALIDYCPRKGVLIARLATDADHDHGLDTFEEYDRERGEVHEYISIAEAEYLGVLAADDAARLREGAASASRESEAA